MREIPRITAASLTLYVRRGGAGSLRGAGLVKSLSRRTGALSGRVEVVGACEVITPVSGQRQHDQAQCRCSRRASPAETVTTEVACGESSQPVLEPSGRRCRGATTRQSPTSNGCAGSATTCVHHELAASTTSRTTLLPVASSPASALESPRAPGPAGLQPTAKQASADSRHWRRVQAVSRATQLRTGGHQPSRCMARFSAAT